MKVKSVAVALAAASIVAVPSTADAAKNPYTPKEICGSSFRVLASQKLGLPGKPSKIAARTYLMYSAATQQNCVTTIKRMQVGTPSYVSTGIRISGTSDVKSDGRAYEYYAGPRKVRAPGRCVDWYGSFNYGPNKSGGFERVREFCG